jgi:hypothetical protein
MVGAEWRACVEPWPLLQFAEGRSSDRKRRLFAVACCRRVWGLIDSDVGRAAVEAADRFADGLLPAEELWAAYSLALSETADADLSTGTAARSNARHAVAGAAAFTRAGQRFGFDRSRGPGRARRLDEAAGFAATEAAAVAALAAVAAANAHFPHVRALDQRDRSDDPVWAEALGAERQAQADLARDVLGNPFRPLSLRREWLTWDGGAVARMARALYDAGDFAATPVLADALEEAGCDDGALLGHLRGGGHDRGCWAVDLLLGRR